MIVRGPIFFLLQFHFVAAFLSRQLYQPKQHGGRSVFQATSSTRRKSSRRHLSSPGSGGESRINDYISDYINKEKVVKEIVLAIPCDACHELQIELESVQRAILYHCPIAVHACLPGTTLKLPILKISSVTSSSASTIEAAVKKVVDRLDLNGVRVQFEKLEIEGGDMSQNQILHAAVSKEDKKTLRKLSEDLKEKVQLDTGFSCHVPDNFRVPFMQLPTDWHEHLKTSQNSAEDAAFLSSDEGGNGISPIFWIEWSEDKFGGPQRLREVGFFEASSRFPFALLPFPGYESMSANELKWEDYQESRLKQAEDSLKREMEGDAIDPKDDDDLSKDPLFLKTRERLEQLYNEDVPAKTESVKEAEWSDIQEDLLESPQRESDPSNVDEWTRQRIKQIVEDKRRRTRPSLQPMRRKDLPPIEENEIFNKFRRGELSSAEEEPAAKRDLPPFPSREHCVGVWEMMESPTGFDVERGDPTKSDNLILRVDGTTAGGPILDQETRHKASGGQWQVDGHDLHIELVIPPQKERALVLSGKMDQPSKPPLPLSRNTFGIPELEAKFKAARANNEEVYCSGSVWIEDVDTHLNRREIGTFAMKKLERPSDGYIINIPRNVRQQD